MNVDMERHQSATRAPQHFDDILRLVSIFSPLKKKLDKYKYKQYPYSVHGLVQTSASHHLCVQPAFPTDGLSRQATTSLQS